ncbi:glycosyltransferase [Erythrobacter sp. NE805]|uniref:glycosyltransferase n=1 Tax=Erythrobacter sp. NE805 TaxID=3389875 RepID=UPI00396AF2E2
MRILLYANADAAEAGGVQAVMRGLAAALAARGHRVATGWAARSAPPRAGGEDGWAEAFHLRRRDGGRRLGLGTALRLAVRLLRERPQVVNIHYASPSTLYFLAFARLLGIRVVVTCHGSDVLRPLPEDAPFLGEVIGEADAVTVVSDEIAARLAAEGLAPRSAPRVIANGIDTQFWAPPQTHRERRGALPTLVAVGRLEEVKGFDILLEACAILAARGAPARLVLVGEGSQGPALRAQAARLGIAAEVDFAGRLPPEAIRAQLHAAELFVLSSRSEGMPLALMEAMASGAACVAADVGGVARTAGGAARLVPPGDPAALAAAIASLIADEGARAALGEQARARARAFSAEAAHAAYEAVIAEVVRGRRA